MSQNERTDGDGAPLTEDNSPLSKPSVESEPGTNLQLTATDPKVPTAALEYLQAAISANTRRAYRSDLNHFLAWGGAIPASPELVVQYIAAHAGKLAVATLMRRIATISRAHTSQGGTSPTASDMVRATLRGIRRTHGVAQRQVSPVLKEDIVAMVRDLRGTKGTRDRALLLLGFAGAFRRSELVGLDVPDLSFVERGLLVTLRRSKTDPEGAGRKIAIPFARGAVCAVQAAKDWLEFSGTERGPLFRGVNRRGELSGSRLSGQAVSEVVKERVAAIGLDPRCYAGHSLRVGLITSAAIMGVSVWKIKAQSGHRSDAMVGRYVRDVDLFTNNAVGAVL